jgi:hypothetical protein
MAEAPPPPPPPGNITFVSVIVHNSADPNPPLKRIEWLLPLLKAELPLVLYVCPFYLGLFSGAAAAATYKNLMLLPINLASTEMFRHVADQGAPGKPPLELPAQRSTNKDTAFFCSLMYVKTELLARTVRDSNVKTPFVAFLDASISKVLAQPAESLEALRTTVLDPKKVVVPLFPGCHPPAPKAHSKEALLNHICWAFCGGFFVVPTTKALDWHVASRDTALRFMREDRRLTWEVNVWAHMVENEGHKVLWFNADHNDSMLRVPPPLHRPPAE